MMCSYRTAWRRSKLLSLVGLFFLFKKPDNLLCEVLVHTVTWPTYLDSPILPSLWGLQPGCQSGSDPGSVCAARRPLPGVVVGGPACRAAPSSSERWEPGRNVPLDCTQDSMFLNSCSGKTAFCCFHTSPLVHFPSLAQAVFFLSVTKGQEQPKLWLPGLCSLQTPQEFTLWEESRVPILSEAVGPPHLLGLLLAGAVGGYSLTRACEDLKNFLQQPFFYWSWFCTDASLHLTCWGLQLSQSRHLRAARDTNLLLEILLDLCIASHLKGLIIQMCSKTYELLRINLLPSLVKNE